MADKPTTEQKAIVQKWLQWQDNQTPKHPTPVEKDALRYQAMLNAVVEATKEAKVIKP